MLYSKHSNSKIKWLELNSNELNEWLYNELVFDSNEQTWIKNNKHELNWMNNLQDEWRMLKHYLLSTDSFHFWMKILSFKFLGSNLNSKKKFDWLMVYLRYFKYKVIKNIKLN